MPEFSERTEPPATEPSSPHSLVSLSQERISTSDRLSSSLSVLGGGIIDGTIDNARMAVRDPNTLLKLGGAFAIGAALTIGNGRRGLLRVAAHGATLGLGGMFAHDLYQRGSTTAAAVADTWNEPWRASQNRALVANTLGPLVVDTAIYGVGGLSGAGFAHQNIIGRTAVGFDPVAIAEARGGRVGGNARVAQPAIEPVTLVETPMRAGASEPQLTTAREVQTIMEPARAPVANAELPQVLEFSMLELGRGFQPTQVRIGSETPLGNLVARTRDGIARVEVFKLENGELGGGTSTAVSVTADGRLVTTRHLVDNAINVTVFDSAGRPHSAHVARVNPDAQVDLAIIQLDNPASFSAFRPLELPAATMEAVPAGTPIAVLGHPNGYSALFVSPGGAGPRFGINSSYRANVHAGSCGSAIVDMDGRLLAMMKNKGTNVNGTSTSYIRGLLNQTESVPLAGSRSENPGSIPLRQSFEVADADSSMAVIETIFGARLRNEIPPDLFYARARRAMVPQEGGQPAEIILRTSFDPINSQVVVRPMALGGRQISGEMTWHGTDTPIGAAELRLRFSDGFSRAEMTSVNDPLNVLTRGLELKGGAPSYLSTLRPTTIVEPLPVRVTEPSLAVAGEAASRAAGTLPEAITTPATSALPADPLVPTSARSTTGGRAGSGSLLRPLISGSAPAGLRQLTNLSY